MKRAKFVGREEELRLVKDSIKLEHSCLIVGSTGIGKSRFLRELKKEYKHSLFIAIPSSKRKFLFKLSKILWVKEIDEDKLVSRLRERWKPLLIFIDDFDKATKGIREFLERVQDFCIVVATSKKKVRFRFQEVIELKPLKMEERKKMISEILGEEREEVVNLIATKSEGIPRAIVELCRDYENAKLLNKIKSRADVHELVNNYKLVPWKKIDLLPLNAMIFLAYLALALKYLLYGVGNLEEAFLVAIFGYTSMALSRLLWSYRKIEKY